MKCSAAAETLQILLFTALGFFLLIKKLEPEPVISLDMDWFYRIGGRAFEYVPAGGRSHAAGSAKRAHILVRLWAFASEGAGAGDDRRCFG